MYREDLSPRVHFDHPVELNLFDHDQQAVLGGRALNISPGGMFVRAPVLLPVGTAITLRCELMPGVELCSEATVVRAVPGDGLEPTGMGVRFDDLDEESAWRLAAYIDRRLQPGRGQPVRLEIDELGTSVQATTQGAWDGTLSVDAPLPFLKLGSSVTVGGGHRDPGQIRWVAVHICPETGVPRLNIGIELAQDPGDPADDKDGGLEDREGIEPTVFDEDRDPICTGEYLAYARSRCDAERQGRDAAN